ncbi:hypothetical protein ACF0H5_011940 [Mactra antiquata]
MDIKTYCTILLVAGCFSSALGNSIETTPELHRHMGENVKLSCAVKTTDPGDWMFIQWKKETGEGTYMNIASMQNVVLSPDWSPNVPDHFRDHVELQKEDVLDGYALILFIEGFICSDNGTYICEVFTKSNPSPMKSQSVLFIEVDPGKPSIHQNVLQVKENDTFDIECTANVGLPPLPLSWSYTLKDSSHIYQKILDGFTQENSPTRDCTIRGKSVLTVEMREELDMATFLCATSSELSTDGSKKNYDEVVVQIYGKTTTTTSTLAPSTPERQQPDDNTGGSSTIPSSVPVILFCCLVAMFELFTRTS